MKLIMDRETLLSPLQGVSGVIERRQSMPVLSHVLLKAADNRIQFTGTDVEVEQTITIEYPVDKPGETTLPARKLLDICRFLPERAKVEIAVDGDRAWIKSGKSKFALATLPAREFPNIGVVTSILAVSVEAGRLKTILKDTEFAMAQQDVRYYLNGLLLEVRESRIRVAATDGHRLAVNELEVKTDLQEMHQVIIPRKGVSELSRMLEGTIEPTEIRIGANHIQVKVGDRTLTSKLIDGRFPDYERIMMQKGDKVVVAEREPLRQALARVSIISSEKFRGVRIALESDLLRASSHNAEREEAEEEIEVDYTGEPLEIGFNVTYLQDALSVIQTERVRLEFLDSKSSCLIRPVEGGGGTHVVMPIRL